MTPSTPQMRLRSAPRRSRHLVLRYRFSLVLTLCVTVWLTGMGAGAHLARQYPAPGRLVDVGGYRLHLNCVGAGAPTVVMDAGANDFSVHWARVQPAVSQFTQVCAYDRAGLGWSEPGPHPRTTSMMAHELDVLLERAGISGPYVLVGHSLGGLTMRLFAQQHPDAVAGMVLVDAAHEEQDVRISSLGAVARQSAGQFRALGLLSRLGLLALAPGQVPARGLPEGAHAQYAAVLATTGFFETAAAETEALTQSFAEARAIRPGSLGAVPLVVLSRGRSEPLPGRSGTEVQADEQAWRVMQQELAALAPSSTHIVAEHSGHYVQLEQPELVIDSIRQVVQAAQSSTPEGQHVLGEGDSNG